MLNPITDFLVGLFGLSGAYALVVFLSFLFFLGLFIYNWKENVLMFSNWKKKIQGWVIRGREWLRFRRDSDYRFYQETVGNLTGACRVLSNLDTQEAKWKYELSIARHRWRRRKCVRLLKAAKDARLAAAAQVVHVVRGYDRDKMRIVAEAYCGFRFDVRPCAEQHHLDVSEVTRALLQTRDQVCDDPQIIYSFYETMEGKLSREVCRKRKKRPRQP
jgi:hypothetical protein